MVFAFARCEEVAELVEELNGPLESRRGRGFIPLLAETYLIVGEMCLGHDDRESSLEGGRLFFIHKLQETIKPSSEVAHGRMSDVWFARFFSNYPGHVEGGAG